MNFKILMIGVLVSISAGCVNPLPRQAPEVDPAIRDAALQPLLCAGKDQCDLYWQRAQVFIATHSHYKIQLVNDTLIQTYGSTGAEVYLAWSLVKVPDGNGGARIQIGVACANSYGCQPDKYFAVSELKKYVKTGA